MRLKLNHLLALLDGKDPEAEVHIQVDGFESAPLRPDVDQADGVILLFLSAESEVAEVLSEADILR